MNWKFWKKTPEPSNIAPQQAQSQDQLKRTVEQRKCGGGSYWGITQGELFYPFGGSRRRVETTYAYTHPNEDVLEVYGYIGLPIEFYPLVEEPNETR